MKFPRIILGVFLFQVGMLFGVTEPAPSDTGRLLSDVPYHEGAALAAATDYQKEKCRMDLLLPTGKKGFATLIWFHGGGLTKGKRAFPDLKDEGIALVAVGYRLSPKAECPQYIEDAAAAVAWVLRHIEKEGGDPRKVFVSGHSAGAYLTAMIGMDPKWLGAHGLSPKALAGLIPVSGQMTTHFLVKKLRGDKGAQYRPLIDEFAPLYHCSKELPPICLITGDRAIEWKARVEENALMAASLRSLGHPHVEFYEMGGLNHSMVAKPAMVVARAFIKRVLEGKGPATLPAAEARQETK